MAAISALAITALAACGSDGSSRAGSGTTKGTLDVWVYQDASTSVQKEFIDKFNESSEYKLNLIQVPGETYQEKMRVAMGSDKAPDIFFNWGGGSISEFVEQDMLLNLTPYLQKDTEFRDSFIPTILNEGQVNYEHYGIPMRGVQPVILFYNKELFEQAGVEPPEDWDDMLGLIDTFTSKGVTPVVLGGGDSWTELMWLEYLLDRLRGAQLFKRIQSGDATAWDDPAALEMAKTARKLIDDGTFGDKYQSTKYTDDTASTLFAKGKAAMHLMGSWEYANQKTNQPKFAEESLGWLPFPAMPEGLGDARAVVGNPTNYWSVNAQVTGAERTAAIEFLKTAASDEYAQALIDNGEVPAITGVEDLLNSHPDPEYAKFQYNMVLDSPTFTLSWDQALPAKQSTAMMTNIEKLFNKQLSPEDFIDAMKKLGEE